MMQISACSCDTCKGFCKQWPGMFLPVEVEAIKAAGLEHRLMKEQAPDVVLYRPAIKGLEGQWIDNTNCEKGPCTFLTDAGLCEIHDMKPFECAVASCKGELPGDFVGNFTYEMNRLRCPENREGVLPIFQMLLAAAEAEETSQS